MSLEPNFECLRLQGELFLHPVKISGKHLERKRELLLNARRKKIIIITPSHGPTGTVLLKNTMQPEICRVKTVWGKQDCKNIKPCKECEKIIWTGEENIQNLGNNFRLTEKNKEDFAELQLYGTTLSLKNFPTQGLQVFRRVGKLTQLPSNRNLICVGN